MCGCAMGGTNCRKKKNVILGFLEVLDSSPTAVPYTGFSQLLEIENRERAFIKMLLLHTGRIHVIVCRKLKIKILNVFCKLQLSMFNTELPKTFMFITVSLLLTQHYKSHRDTSGALSIFC